MKEQTVHASAVLIGNDAVLIRGPSGSGKSRLAFDLILAGQAKQIPDTTLIGDDRLHLTERDGQLFAACAPALAGLIEIRGLGIRRIACAPGGTVRLVVDLSAPDAARLPDDEALLVKIGYLTLPRLPVGAGYNPLPLVLAAVLTRPANPGRLPQADCSQDIGNHIRPTLATF